jgi:hypothetical protein
MSNILYLKQSDSNNLILDFRPWTLDFGYIINPGIDLQDKTLFNRKQSYKIIAALVWILQLIYDHWENTILNNLRGMT